MRRTHFLKRAVAAIFILAVFMTVLRLTRSPAGNSVPGQLANVDTKGDIKHDANIDAKVDSKPKVDARADAKAGAKVDSKADPKGDAKAAPKAGNNVNLQERIQHQDLMDELADPKAQQVLADDSPSEEELEAQAIAEGKKIYEGIVSYSSVPPVIVFSKSYCPHSKRAKTMLLEDYVIKPTPLVIELDIIKDGDKLQKYLHLLTGRRTVPNIMIDGVSRGGASDIAELGEELPAKFKEWGNNKLTIKKA